MYQEPLYRCAALARIPEATLGRQVDGEIKVGVLQDDQGRVAAQLENQLFISGPLSDQLPNLLAAGEAHHLDAGIGDQRVGHLGGRPDKYA